MWGLIGLRVAKVGCVARCAKISMKGEINELWLSKRLPQDLVREAVIGVAQLPENDLWVVIETVTNLKKQRSRPDRTSAAQIVARAKQRANETSHLSREELMKQFGETLESIRADAIAKGTVLDKEWEGD